MNFLEKNFDRHNINYCSAIAFFPFEDGLAVLLFLLSVSELFFSKKPLLFGRVEGFNLWQEKSCLHKIAK